MKKYLNENNYEYYYKYPLNKLTTINNNGYTKYFILIKNIDELINLIKYLKEEKIKYLIIGNGSKLVFLNNYKGVIISLKKLNNITMNEYIVVESGVNILTLVNKIKKFNLGGIEELSGIPSSVGGALVNNAEAHNVSLYDYLVKVLVYKDKLFYLNKEEINYSYRYSSLKNNFIVLKAYFKFKDSNIELIDNNIKKYLNYRKEKQVITYPNIGSIFKNMDNLKVIDIIKKCNLENFKYKNVSLNKKHLNFIDIKGKTKGKYIYIFIKKIQKKVKRILNIDIESEIIFIK